MIQYNCIHISSASQLGLLMLFYKELQTFWIVCENVFVVPTCGHLQIKQEIQGGFFLRLNIQGAQFTTHRGSLISKHFWCLKSWLRVIDQRSCLLCLLCIGHCCELGVLRDSNIILDSRINWVLEGHCKCRPCEHYIPMFKGFFVNLCNPKLITKHVPKE